MQYSYDNLSKASWGRIAAVSSLWLGIVCVVLAERGLVRVDSASFWCVLVLVMLALCFISTRRSTYLPFLSETVLPGSLLEKHGVQKTDGISVTVAVDPNAEKVAYWAATKAGGRSPGEAYGTFENSGVVHVNNGQAKLVVDCPGQYYVRGKLLKNHVHYREVFSNGITGPVKKADVLCA